MWYLQNSFEALPVRLDLKNNAKMCVRLYNFCFLCAESSEACSEQLPKVLEI